MKEITFELSGEKMRMVVPDDVYEPHDDTYLLAECALGLNPKEALEIGCGCGAVSVCLAKKGCNMAAADISPIAVNAARENALKNKVKIDAFESDLFSNVPKEKKFSCILFNPPYLPTEEHEKVRGKLNFAFDGGRNGLETVFRFLENAGAHLKKGGKILLVCSSAQNLQKLGEKIRKCGFEFEIIAQDSFFFEKLYVYELTVK